MKRIPVIIDTDIGSDIDDTWSLAAMLGDDTFDIRLISTVWEDVQYKCALVSKLTAVANRTVPVVAGTPSQGGCRAQEAWLGEEIPHFRSDLEESYLRAAEKEDFITVVALGPMTNLARVVKKYPHLARKLHIVAMIGAIRKGYINETVPGAEYNVIVDPQAFRDVLTSGASVVIAPLDVCRDYVVDGADYAALKSSSAPLARAVLENYEIWNRDYSGGALKYPAETSSSILYDLLPVYYLLYPHFFDTETLGIEVTGDGKTVEAEKGAPALCLLGFRGREICTRYLINTLTGGLHGQITAEKDARR